MDSSPVCGFPCIEQVAQLTHIWQQITDLLKLHEINACRKTSRAMRMACDNLMLYPTLTITVNLDRDADTEIDLYIPLEPMSIFKSTAFAENYGIVCDQFMADIAQYLDSCGIICGNDGIAPHFSMGYIDHEYMKFNPAIGIARYYDHGIRKLSEGLTKGIHTAIIDHRLLHKHNKLEIKTILYLAGCSHDCLFRLIDDGRDAESLTTEEENDIMKKAVELSHKYFQY